MTSSQGVEKYHMQTAQEHVQEESQSQNIDNQCDSLGFNDTSTFVGHFVLSPSKREKIDRRDSTGDVSEGQGRQRKWNESEETEETKHSPSTLTCYKESRPCPTVSQYQLDAPVT